MASLPTLPTTSEERSTASSFGERLLRMPIELLLAIVDHLHPDEEQSRSPQTTALLGTLMKVDRRLRSILRPIYWSEVHLASADDVSCAVASEVLALRGRELGDPPSC